MPRGGRTSGTWSKGNGQGRGGPARAAKGDTQPFTVESPGRVLASLNNSDPETIDYRADQRIQNRIRRTNAWKATDALVADKTHPSHWSAIRDTKDRLEGVPAQRVDLNARVAAAGATDADLLAIALAGGGGVIASPENPDEPA